MKGTKFGSGIAQFGACTVHLAGNPVRSCSLTLSVVAGQTITTIEGIDGRQAEAVQKAWIEEQAPQCGYYQSGQIMSAVALLKRKPQATDADILGSIPGKIRACGTYDRTRNATDVPA